MLETNRISELLESYIEYKHSLGFEIKQEISVLRNFQRYTLEKDYTGALTKNIVLEWISSGILKQKLFMKIFIQMCMQDLFHI